MLLKNLVQRKPLLPPPALGFQKKSLYSSSPLGRFETPLGQNLDRSTGDDFVYPFSQPVEIQNVKTSINSTDEDIDLSSQSSESTNDILDKENQVTSDSVNELQNDKLLLRAKQNSDNCLTKADITSPSLTDCGSEQLSSNQLNHNLFSSEQDSPTTDTNLQKSDALENQELIVKNLSQDKASIQFNVDRDSKDYTENQHLSETLESLKPLAQNSDFYISRFVADYLSNKPGIYSSALLESQNQSADNIASHASIDSTVSGETENHQTIEKLQNSEITPIQQINKIQTSLKSSTPENFLKTDLSPKYNPIEFQLKQNSEKQSSITSETNFTKNNPEITVTDSNEIQTQPESLTGESLLNSPLSNHQEQDSVNLRDNITSSNTQLSATEQVSENIIPRNIPLQQKIVNLNLDSVNQNQQNSEQSNPVEQKPNIQNRVSQNINLDSNISSEIPQQEAENINQTSSEENIQLEKQNLSTLPSSSEQSDEITTVSENLNQHKLASSLSENTQIQTCISEETTNKSLKLGLKPSTHNNLKTLPENFNKNIQKSQLSKVDTEKQNVVDNNISLASLTSNSENNYQISESLLQTEKSEPKPTSEVIQPQLTNPNQSIDNQIAESKDLSPQSLDNNSNIQSSPTEENISIDLPLSTSPKDISAETKNNTLYPQIQVKSDLPTSITQTSSSNTFSESLPEKTNYSHLPPLSKLSPLVKESDIQLSRFVNNSNILATNSDNQLQPLTEPSLEDGLNSENTLPSPEEPQNNPNVNLKVSDSEQPINRSEKVNSFSSNTNLNTKLNQPPDNIIDAKYQSDNVRPNNDSIPDSWSDISELIGDISPTNTSPYNNLNPTNNLNTKPNQSPDNIIDAKYQSDNVRPDNDSIPDSWSDISELISDTSPTNTSPYNNLNPTNNLNTKPNQPPDNIVDAKYQSDNVRHDNDSIPDSWSDISELIGDTSPTNTLKENNLNPTNNLNTKPNQPPDNIINTKYQSDNVRHDNDSIPDSWSDISELIGDTSPTNTSPYNNLNPTNNLNTKPNQSPDNIIDAKYQSYNLRPDNDSIPDSWSDISELIGDTSLTNTSNTNITNKNSYEDNIINLSSTQKTNFTNNLFDNQNQIQKESVLLEDSFEKPLKSNAEITNKFSLFYSNLLDSKDNQNKQISQSEKSLGVHSNEINEENLEIMSYQIYIIIRQKLEIDRESQGRSLLGYPDWLNMIPLNLSIGSYQKINQVDFLDAKMNLLAMEVYKLISFRLEAEKELCVR